MAREIEAKFRAGDPQAWRARLDACGAQPSARVLETNRILDTPARELLAKDCALRLRTCQPLEGDRQTTATLTYKGPRATGLMKAREEIETHVADPVATMAILQQLGFSEVLSYQKRRETWRLGDCEVCLDELPELGWFVEVEGPSPTAVESVLERLELSIQAALRETYVEMAAAHGRLTPDGPRWLHFEQKRDAT
jgi:adenylate cyclase class 2